MRQIAFVCLAVVASSLPGCSRQDPVAIKYKWEKGHVIQQRMTTESSTKMSGDAAGGPGGGSDYTGSEVQDFRWRVLDVKPDGTATIEMIITRQRTTSNGPEGTLTIDSGQPAPSAGAMDPIVKVMKQRADAQVGKAITIEIDQAGEILKLTGAPAFRRVQTADGPDPATLATLANTMMHSKLQPFYYGWPEKAVGVGDSWDVKPDQQSTARGFLPETQSRKLKSITTVDGRRMATVTSKSVMPAQTLGNKGDTRPIGMPEFAMEMLERTATGQYVFDLDWGRMHRASITMEMPFEFDSPAGGKMKTTTKATITIEAIY